MSTENKRLPLLYFLLIPTSILSIIANPVLSQTTNHRLKFSEVNEVGLTAGSQSDAVVVHTINGVKTDKTFAGVGVGLDFYGYRSVPLFITYHRDFNRNKNTPFLYLDGGANFLWLNDKQKAEISFPDSSPGYCYDLGLGWKLAGKNQRCFLFSAGYTLKQERYKLRSWNMTPIPELQPENYDRYNYLYRRIVVKIGFQL